MLEIIVPFSFYVLTGIMIYSLPVLLKPSKAIFNRKRKSVRYFMYGFVTWILYLSWLSNNGFLNDFSMPPKTPLMVIIPILIILYWYSGRPYVLKTIKTVPIHRLIYIQSFRIVVELLIWGAFLLGVFPEVVTFEGLNFDVWVGVSALPIGYLAHQNKIGKKALIIWNWLGLLVLATTVYQFVIYFFLSDFEPNNMSAQIVSFPYLFLAALLMPLAVFYHMLSIRQLRMTD